MSISTADNLKLADTSAPVSSGKIKFIPAEGHRTLTLEGSYSEAAKQIAKIIGAGDADVGLRFLGQASATHPSIKTNPAEAYNETLEMVRGIKPTDGLEGMLAIQMVSLHQLSMRTMGSTCGENSVEHNSFLADRAVKLMRTFAKQMEALSSYRGKGRQKITVEHVHVNDGGKAIIGVAT